MENRRPSKDSGCCSVNFLEYVMFIFNFFFYLAGIAVLGVGLWTWFYKFDYVSLLPTKMYISATYVLIGTGALVLLVGIVGCVGVLKESRSWLLVFTFLLLLVFLLEAAAGILAFIYGAQVHKELEQSLKTTINDKYGEDEKVTRAVENLHTRFSCCGANNFQDWVHSKWYTDAKSKEHETLLARKQSSDQPVVLKVPFFCCRSPSETCGKRDHPSNIYYSGCLDALTNEIRDHAVILSAVGLGISVIQIIGTILSCCLYAKLKDFDDYKRYKADNSYYQ